MTSPFDALAEEVAALARSLDTGAARFDFNLLDGGRLSFGFDRDRPDELVVAVDDLIWIWHERWDVS